MFPILLASSVDNPSMDDILKIVIVGGGILIGFVAVVFGMVASILKHRQMERTRREVAAYVAEGSMTADEGERLLRAGRGPAQS
ncbi:MAG: hypothetical protein J0L61_12750 [Planctomycetes bacterium]|nr:hypothetical protein [Planctomycetota bacterium]